MRALLARRGATDEAAGDPVQRRADQITLWTRVAAVVAGLGLVAVVVLGIVWWTALHGSSAKDATARDDALAAARQIAVNLQTLDYNNVDKGLAIWESSSTGPLLTEFQKNHQQYADQIRKVQTSTSAKLVDAALSDVDVAAGKAKAIASVDVTTSQTANGAPSLPVTKQVRIALDLVRTPDAGWKAASASAIRS
jgi:Mce-associated membrane protein